MPKVGQVVYFKSSPFKGMQLQNQGGENFHCLVKCFPVFNWVHAEVVFSFLMLDCTWKGRAGPDFPTSSCSSPAPTRKDSSCNAQTGLAIVYSRVFHVIAHLPFPKHQLEKLSSQGTRYLSSSLRGTDKFHMCPTVNLARSLHT